MKIMNFRKIVKLFKPYSELSYWYGSYKCPKVVRVRFEKIPFITHKVNMGKFVEL